MNPETHIEYAVVASSAAGRFTDTARWLSLTASATVSHEAWLALFSASLDLAIAPLAGQDTVVVCVMLAMGVPDSGHYPRVANFGSAGVDSLPLAKAAEKALSTRRALVQRGEATGPCHVALPILLEGRLHGVVAIELSSSARPHLETAMRAAQWGVAWLGWKLKVAYEPKSGAAEASIALEAVRQAASGPTIASGSLAAATYLAEAIGADRVGLGIRRHKSTKLLALSHGGFGDVMTTYLEAMRDAMNEAAGSGKPVLAPAGGEDAPASGLAHARLLRAHDADWAISVPCHIGADTDTAMTMVWTATGRNEAPPGLVARLSAACEIVSPLLAARADADRPIGTLITSAVAGGTRRLLRGAPTSLLAPLSALAVALALLFVQIDYEVTGDATVEGTMRRSIVAPFDGYIASADARPGDRLEAGARLGSLDDRELKLQKLEAETRIDELSRQIDEALGQRDQAKVNILTARREQAQAQLQLVAHNLSRRVLTAPFASFVVTGDRTQAIGAPLRRGDVLYEISPLETFRVVMEVPHTDFADVQAGLGGRVLLSSLPFEAYPFKVERLAPVAMARDGRTAFRVEGQLVGAVGSAVRPGMQGIARINVGQRRLGWVLTHALATWVRIKLWAYVP